MGTICGHLCLYTFGHIIVLLGFLECIIHVSPFSISPESPALSSCVSVSSFWHNTANQHLPLLHIIPLLYDAAFIVKVKQNKRKKAVIAARDFSRFQK